MKRKSYRAKQEDFPPLKVPKLLSEDVLFDSNTINDFYPQFNRTRIKDLRNSIKVTKDYKKYVKYNYNPPPIGNIKKYEITEELGKGTYGTVYKAVDIQTRRVYALKKMRKNKNFEGILISTLREINLVKNLIHSNIIQFKEIVTDDQEQYRKCYLVFEFMDHDLAGLIEAHWTNFTIPEIKCYMKQILQGLQYCHSKRVAHRDLKGANMLINNRGELKLADFGLAKEIKIPHGIEPFEDGFLTNRVITLWYRPPEVLLGSTSYSFGVDIWSAGCLFVELLSGKALFQGTNEIEQIHKIFEVCGTPTEETWPNFDKYCFYELFEFTDIYPRKMRECLSKLRLISDGALDLIDQMLVLDPSKRISASQALSHPYFKNDPLPLRPDQLPQYEISCHEFRIKQLRKKNLRSNANNQSVNFNNSNIMMNNNNNNYNNNNNNNCDRDLLYTNNFNNNMNNNNNNNKNNNTYINNRGKSNTYSKYENPSYFSSSSRDNFDNSTNSQNLSFSSRRKPEGSDQNTTYNNNTNYDARGNKKSHYLNHYGNQSTNTQSHSANYHFNSNNSLFNQNNNNNNNSHGSSMVDSGNMRGNVNYRYKQFNRK